jgi:hypothetical protein
MASELPNDRDQEEVMKWFLNFLLLKIPKELGRNIIPGTLVVGSYYGLGRG